MYPNEHYSVFGGGTTHTSPHMWQFTESMITAHWQHVGYEILPKYVSHVAWYEPVNSIRQQVVAHIHHCTAELMYDDRLKINVAGCICTKVHSSMLTPCVMTTRHRFDAMSTAVRAVSASRYSYTYTALAVGAYHVCKLFVCLYMHIW
jgi:hypothetical protein